MFTFSLSQPSRMRLYEIKHSYVGMILVIQFFVNFAEMYLLNQMQMFCHLLGYPHVNHTWHHRAYRGAWCINMGVFTSVLKVWSDQDDAGCWIAKRQRSSSRGFQQTLENQTWYTFMMASEMFCMSFQTSNTNMTLFVICFKRLAKISTLTTFLYLSFEYTEYIHKLFFYSSLLSCFILIHSKCIK